MKPTFWFRLLFWLPRILAIGFIIFLSLFALDVFSEYSGWALIVPLIIHLIPSLILLVLLVFAWKYDLVGIITFFGIAVLYVFMAGFNRPLSWYLAISGPAVIVSVLFFVSMINKDQKQK